MKKVLLPTPHLVSMAYHGRRGCDNNLAAIFGAAETGDIERPQVVAAE
jgi:hypothetical protein